MKLKGRKVVHSRTGKIKVIASVKTSGIAIFEDGTGGDVHVWGEPSNQHEKVWKYLDETNPPNVENYQIY